MSFPKIPSVPTARRVALAAFVIASAGVVTVRGASLPRGTTPFLEQHCFDCHDSDLRKGDLDLTALKFEPTDAKNFALWVKVHDRAASGEMPPKKRDRPPAAELANFTATLSSTLVSADADRIAREGRATQRRLNRYEFENALRDLLGAPWLQVKDALPEDGESHRFNKIGDALDMSHVQMARYLNVVDYALRQVMATQAERPPASTTRYYARDQRSFTGPMKFSVFNTSPERATFPLIGPYPQAEVRAGRAPTTVGAANPGVRELEAVGMAASSYEPLEPKFNAFKAPVAGRYKLRVNAFSVWVGPGKDPKKWFIPDLDNVSDGRRTEPVTIYSELPPRQLRWLGKFDATPEPAVHELDVWLLAGETIRPDPARFFRSRPGAGRWQNPLAEKDGQPGAAFRWLEVEGPLTDAWPTAGHRLMFGDLPIRQTGKNVEVVSENTAADAARLMKNFLARAYRRPVAADEAGRFLPVVEQALKSGSGFADAMIAGYTAALCAPEFVCLEEKPGRLDDHAIAARLSFFLWNSPPDDALRALAANGRLHRPDELCAQTTRLLAD
ncbi:MAG: hypothetical protein RLZZ15_448, partial [Verrucomicrobiota bacterium]